MRKWILGLCVLWPVMVAANDVDSCLEAEAMNSGRGGDIFLAGYCLGTIQGARDMAMMNKAALGAATTCVPIKKSTVELAIEFNRSRAQFRSVPLSGAVSAFLVKNYPCN